MNVTMELYSSIPSKEVKLLCVVRRNYLVGREFQLKCCLCFVEVSTLPFYNVTVTFYNGCCYSLPQLGHNSDILVGVMVCYLGMSQNDITMMSLGILPLYVTQSKPKDKT